MTAIRTALEGFRPDLVAAVTYRIERNFKRMTELVAAHGGSWWYINAWIEPEVQAMWREVTRKCCDTAGNAASNKDTDARTLNAEAVVKAANRQADQTIAEWEAKLVSKLAELDSGEAVRQTSGMGFLITGTKEGTAVSIEQNMIINVSSKGKLFNQFPARIYVAGKFTSEAAYKRMFAK